MVIFFHSSIFGKEKYKENYEAIVKICKKLGHKVYAEHMLKRDYHDTDKFTREQHQEDFQRLTSQIKESDMVVVEGSYPSTGTGHYMTIALNYSKPVLVLYTKNPHGVLVGDPNRLLFLKKYGLKDAEDLEQKIISFIDLASKRKLKNRFNLMIDDETLNFLTVQSAKLNQSKADFIRNLIRELMDKN
ncbi:MAG: hypothetical protein HQK53_20120 [Oligoflexia bacterium]|nr:hypothetical protein [Oligoflexia bacterium]